ncbi:cytoplasmic protein [Desarmillaria ectypa]|nr:cytoplasmic protein [Desarmillaria ectypa]
MSTLLKVVKALFSVFCGGQSQEPSKPPEQHQPVSQPPPHQPSPPPHYPSSPHRPPKYEDDNQKNQQNEYYIDLRARANKEGDEMAKCFSESHEAYSRGDGAAAKELSNQGKKHQQKMEELNKEASDWIFIENNRDSEPGEIDLHGLYVKEAIARTDIALEEAKRRGNSEMRLIVGKGLHSRGGTAKIRPAIEKLMRKHQLVAELDPSNSGVLVVVFNGARDRGVGPDEIARRLDRDDGGCVVM